MINNKQLSRNESVALKLFSSSNNCPKSSVKFFLSLVIYSVTDDVVPFHINPFIQTANNPITLNTLHNKYVIRDH